MNAITVPLNVTLHVNQKKIHESGARFKVIKAGKRFGKSRWATFEIAQRAGLKPNGTFWYIAPSYGQARDIAWNDLMWIIPSHMIRSKSQVDLRIELVNGAKIYLKGAENEVALRGPALDGVIFDERAYMKEEIWARIIRGQLSTTNGFAYFISSPNEKGKNHFTHFCEMAKQRMDSGDKDWAYFHFTIYDNPTIPPQEIEDMKNSMPDYIWDLEYMAKESELAGQLFSEFSHENNVGVYDDLPYSFNPMGMDYGLSHPSANLWAKVCLNPKTIYIYDEYVKAGSIISDVCETIKNKSGASVPTWAVIDPSAVKRDPATLKSIVTSYREAFRSFGGEWENFAVLEGDRRDRGYDIVKMYLKRGVIKVHPKCKTLIYQFQNVQWGDKEGEDATDAARYLCVRIHDTITGMNVLPDEPSTQRPKLSDPQEMSLNDPILFPKRAREQGMNWIMQELEEINAA